MSDIDNDIKRFESLRQRKETLEKKQIEINLRLERLREEYKRYMDVLKTSFDVSSIDEAVGLRDKLRESLNEQADRLEKSLNEFEEKLNQDNSND